MNLKKKIGMKKETRTEEIKQIFSELEKAGLNPQWCDTPVTFIDSGVQAGIPVHSGDYTRGECVMLPHSLVNGNMTFTIVVRGFSMKDADILPGDHVQLTTGVVPQDGDIVIASIDDEYTLKSFCVDEQGNHWLVPHNSDFKPMQLTPDMNVRILGKVTCVMKDAPRVSHAEQIRILRNSSSFAVRADKQPPTTGQVEEAIRAAGAVVKQKRQWYAVFRALVDAEVYGADEYDPFVATVTGTVPGHGRLPSSAELRRMAVQSFRKEVSRWKESDAPVSKSRFAAYLRIARLTAETLQG